ncbi:thiamine pyrophosphokinase [Pseudobutyrivibrio sp. ACV-2]|uniref:thiamine diphosphokinase n=1 Tax=Pseudobutyrivibrio sp. ACV-2 TaxID=1520801 RepID=UPI000894E998|nr:thiamine diphosphokinase [Pseudobutyrivibrio sp. ACV-2]SEA18428.1 thiamine pyrophosphokinase [Pseudobutyrivibrio sp. ACV-2]
MTVLIVAGGEIDKEFTKSYIKYIDNHALYIIACDKGYEACEALGITPKVLVGDFDSVDDAAQNRAKSAGIEMVKLNPIKDDTDVEVALNHAFSVTNPGDEIYMIGCTGGRLDHTIGNFHLMGMGAKCERAVIIVDSHNHIEMITPGETYVVEPETQFGKYVSVFPFMGPVTGLTMTGFKYPVTNKTLEGFDTLTVSNEVKTSSYAEITIESGYLIVMETRD